MTYKVLMEIDRMSRDMTRYEMTLAGSLFQEALQKADEDIYRDVVEQLNEEGRQRAAEWTASQDEP